MKLNFEPIIQPLKTKGPYSVDVLRLDLVHPEVSGNKWFKLKYNLLQAKEQNFEAVVTFGGAFSNHIAATAAACKLFNLKSVGIIRGEKPEALNDTLKAAEQNGMQLHFVSREDYRKKGELDFANKLKQKFGKHYLIPEGGNNLHGLKGCMEIIKPGWQYDFVICACGTGTTYAGLMAKAGQKIIGINILKGKNELLLQTLSLLNKTFPDKLFKLMGNEELEGTTINNNFITDKFSFSGYAAYDKILVDFKSRFEQENNIPLDYVYTTKLFYAVNELINSKKFPENAKILIIHSGGLQGNSGFEQRFRRVLTSE